MFQGNVEKVADHSSTTYPKRSSFWDLIDNEGGLSGYSPVEMQPKTKGTIISI